MSSAAVSTLVAPAPSQELGRYTAEPVAVYLAHLAPNSRRAVRHDLSTIAELLSSGGADLHRIPWHLLRYEHVAAIRQRLAERSAPASAGGEIVDRILATGLFAGKDDVARFAAAVAMRANAPPAPARGAGTVWPTKGLDSAGELATAIALLYPGKEEPCRLLEGLINAGLQLIQRHMEQRGGLVLPELVGNGE